MTQTGFYRRPLPPALVPFASAEGRVLFREALREGHLEGWFSLAEQFQTQAEPAFCGLGTLVVALNALGIDPGRLWKGPWRWYSEELLDCCLPLETVREKGITLGQFACLARCNGAAVEVRRPDSSSLEAFRANLEAAAAAPDGVVAAVSYSRRALGQTGEGHFSPVAGIHAGRDLALVLDVARFKYPPHWVPVPALFDAMLPPDPLTGKPRGWVVLRRRPGGTSMLFRLSDAKLPWAAIATRLLVDVPARLIASAPTSSRQLVASLVDALSPDISSLLAALPRSLDELVDEHRAHAEALIEQLRAAPLFAAVAALTTPVAAQPWAAELVTMLVLGLPERVFVSLEPALRSEWNELRAIAPSAEPLSAEAERVREQIAALGDANGPLAGTTGYSPCG